MSDDIRVPGDRGPSVGGGLGGLRTPNDPNRFTPVRPASFRERIPSMAQLRALIRDGQLILPRRYFRGYFLDMIT